MLIIIAKRYLLEKDIQVSGMEEVLKQMNNLSANAGGLTKQQLIKQVAKLQNQVEMNIPQSQALPGQVVNEAGGYSFKVDDLKQLQRFLVIGTESGTYYTKPQDLLKQNVQSVASLLKNGRGMEVLETLVEYSVNGRVTKEDPILLALALCANCGDNNIRRAAYEKVPIICNIPTKLFAFVEIGQNLVNCKRTSGIVPAAQPNKRRAPTEGADTPPTKKKKVKDAMKKVNTEHKRSSGWGRMRRKGIAAFYTDPTKDANKLLYLLTKYKNRKHWSHKQVLGYAHPKIKDDQKDEKNLVLTYCTRGYESFEKLAEKMKSTPFLEEVINNIKVVEIVANLSPEKAENETMLLNIFRQYGTTEFQSITPGEPYRKAFTLVREHVPNGFLRSAKLWEIMLQDMPMTAMIRNLGKMTALGLFDQGKELNVALVVSKLTDVQTLKRARIHPVKLLIAMKTYEKGKGIQGSQEVRPVARPRKAKAKAQPAQPEEKKEEALVIPNTWKPNEKILKALDNAFYKSFKQPELKDGFKTGKKFMLALDVSGSMNYSGCFGCEQLTPAVASVALSMVTWNVEDDCEIVAFGGHLEDIKGSVLKKDMTVIQAMRATSSMNFGSTDCALPMTEALRKNIYVDVFIVYTDSDTYVGKIHPAKAIVKYREQMNPNARLIVCAMQSNQFSIADPADDGMLDICGFDANVPDVIAQFSKGEI